MTVQAIALILAYFSAPIDTNALCPNIELLAALAGQLIDYHARAFNKST